MFDFLGAPGGIYTLFSAPQFVVNMRLHKVGPKARYINAVGVVFAGYTHTFNTHVMTRPHVLEDDLNWHLKPRGKATVSGRIVDR